VLLLPLPLLAQANSDPSLVEGIKKADCPPPTADWLASAQPITLQAALRLGQIANLDIAQAAEVVNQARAALLRASVAALPNFNLGSTYAKHEGNIAKTEGNIIKANKDSLFVGGGPSLILSTADAIYLPLVARSVVTATQARSRVVNNDTLLAVAEAYFSVLRARRRLARVEETLDYLASDKVSPARSKSKGLFYVIESFAKAGVKEAHQGEVERVRTEILRREEERVAALQDLRLATAELARLIRLDPTVPLWPVDDFRFPLPLPGEAWLSRSQEELVEFALSNRPELAENRALVQAALERVRNVKARPFLPNVIMNYNWGDFGGGPDLNPPKISPPAKPGGPPTVTAQPGFGPSGQIHHFAPRADFDIGLVWRLQNLGLGDRANVRESEAVHRQTLLRQQQVQDLVVTQVVQVEELVRGWRRRVDVARKALFDAKGAPQGPVFQSIRLNFERIENREARPLEVLDSIRGLNDTLEAYGQAVTDYERARFRLLIVLGLPPQTFLDPEGTSASCLPAR
jgi:outer membrane protein TolC